MVTEESAREALWSTRPRRAMMGEERAMRIVAQSLSAWSTWRDCDEGLRVGVVCDTSRAMGPFAPHMASLAWVLGTAAHVAAWPQHRGRAGTVCAATVLAGGRVEHVTTADDVRPISPFPTEGPSRIDEGVRVATSTASLVWSVRAARLMVLITDAHCEDEVRERTSTQIEELRHDGCAVLWIATTDTSDLHAFGDVPVHVIHRERHLAPRVLGAAVLDAMVQTVPYRPDPQPVPERV